MHSLHWIFHRVVWLAAMLLILPIATRGDDQSGTIANEVPKLIRQLDANTRTERLTAEQRLVELGPQILPLLPPPELLPSASVRDSVARLRITLEQRLARESVQPARITLSVTASIAEQVQSLAQLSGNRLILDGLSDADRARRVEVDEHDASFWPMLDDLCSRTGLRYQLDDQTNAVRIRTKTKSQTDPPASTETGVAYAGAFRVSALAPQRRDVAGSADRQLLRVPLRVLAEPRLRPLFLQFATLAITAHAADGLALAPFSPEAKYELPLAEKGRRAAAVDVDFLLSKDAALQRIDLRGKLTVTTAAGSELISFPNLRQAAAKKNAFIARRRGGVTVTLERANITVNKQNQTEITTRITVAYDSGGPAFESHRSWLLHNEVFLTHDGGERIAISDYETALQEDGLVSIQYRFIDDQLRNSETAPDYTFTYVAPTLLIDVPIEFDLKNISISPP